MINLSNRNNLYLSPAETLMILDPIDSSGKAMIRATFLELILLKVIRVNKKVEITNITTNTKAPFFYISKGINFKSFNPRPHQSILLEPLYQGEKVILRYLISYVLNYSGQNFHDFKIKYVYRPLVELGFFKNSFLYRFLIFKLTDRGSNYRSISKDKIEIGNKYFEKWLISDKEKAKNYFAEVGSNIFLLEKLSFELLSKINSELEFIESELKSSDVVFDPFFDTIWATEIGQALHDAIDGDLDSFFDVID